MERKTKIGMGVPVLVGAVFGMMGAVFLTVGICLLYSRSDAEAVAVGTAFTPLGAVFLIVGIGAFVTAFLQKRQADRLVANGRFLWGQIVEFTPNYNIRVNNRHPYVAIVRCTDGAGMTHIFRSRNLYKYPDPSAVGKQVKVYIENDRFKPYYVDIDPALPQVIEH